MNEKPTRSPNYEVLFYLSPNHNVTEDVLKTARELHKWLMERDLLDDEVQPSVELHVGMANLLLGERVVWCSETDEIDELSVVGCLRSFRRDARVGIDKLNRLIDEQLGEEKETGA